MIPNITFVKFCIKLKPECRKTFPMNKSSAIRGGVGNVLLEKHCLFNGKCDACRFEKDCIVQQAMYAKYDLRPNYITSGESTGYSWECIDTTTEYDENDRIKISLSLYGKCITLLNEYVGALSVLGTIGLGKNKAKFKIEGIYDFEDLLEKQNLLTNLETVNLSLVKVRRLQEYVDEKLVIPKSGIINISFVSPVSLKHNGKYLRKIDADVLYRAMCRRIHMLGCFEGIQSDVFSPDEIAPFRIVNQDVFQCDVSRYSNRKNSSITLQGVQGKIRIKLKPECPIEAMKIIYIGSIVNIGKNVSMGFGKYVVDA